MQISTRPTQRRRNDRKTRQYEAFEFAIEASGLLRGTNGSYGGDVDERRYLVDVGSSVPGIEDREDGR